MTTFPCARSVSNGTNTMRWIIFGALIFGFIGFIGRQVWHVVSAPTLAIAAPLEGQITGKAEITVTGTAEPEAMVEINGQPVYSKPDGSFAQTIELQSGANQIFVRAEKKHGLFTTVSRTIMLQPPAAEIPSVSLSPVDTSAAGSLN